MDANTTAAVDILIRTSMGQATSDFKRILDRMESDARAFADRLKTIFNNINLAQMINQKGQSIFGGGTNARGGLPKDAAMDAAMKDIQKLQAQRMQMERELTRQLNKENNQQESDRVKAFKRSMNEIANSLRSSESQFKGFGVKAGNAFNSAFAGTFLGLSAQQGVVIGLRKIGEFISDIFSKSLDFSNAVNALAQFEGSTDKARAKVQELITVANQTPGLKFDSAVIGQQKLEAVGFESEKATKLLAGLAKIRILSGTTKQDFDIMITELAKFSQGGEQTGRVFRELANHMPALISLIKERFGTLNEETLKAAGGPKKFLDELVKILDTVNPKFNDTSLAVENLGDAYDRWKISLGAIIERNPDLVAAINVTTDTVNHNTEALNKNDSQARQNAENWVSRIAKLSITIQNFLDKVIALTTDAGVALGDVINLVVAQWQDGFAMLGKGIDLAFILPINNAIDAINKLKGVLASIPGFGGIGGIADIPALGFISGDPRDPTFFSQAPNLRTRQAEDTLRRDTQYGNSAYARADQISRQRWTDFNTERQRVIDSRNAPTPAWNHGSDADTMDTTKHSAKGFAVDLAGAQKEAAISGFQAALAKLDPALRNQILDAAARWGIPSAVALAQIFQESTFKAGAVSNQGAYGLTQVQPATGNAALKSQGISQRVTGQSLLDPSNALLAWGAEMNRLYEKYGDWNMVALAYHGGEGTANAYIKAAEKGKAALAGFAKGNPKGFQYVQLLRARSGIGNDAYDPASLSDALTKEKREAADRQFVELLKRFPDLFVGATNTQAGGNIIERAATSLARQRGVAQPQSKAAQLGLLGIGGATTPLTTTSQLGDLELQRRPSLNEAYTRELTKQLNVEGRMTDDLIRQGQIQEEISERARDYRQTLREQSTEAKVQLGLAEARNPLDEAAVTFEQRRATLLNESKDNERDIAALRAENLDSNMVALRQSNAATRERLGLELDISRLSDENAALNANEQLRIRRDLLSDILDLRQQEVDAISDAGRASLEINRQTEYSAARANAELLKFMASQNGVTESMADFRKGLVESGYDLIDRGLTAILPKFGRLTDAVHNLLGSMLKLGVNWVFRKLFGLDTHVQGTPQSGGSTAGGLSSFLQQFIGGGGQGGQGSAPSGFALGSGLPAFMNTTAFNPAAAGGNFSASPFDFSRVLTGFGGASGGTGGTGITLSGSPNIAGGIAGVGANYPTSGIGRAGGTFSGLSGLFKNKQFQNQLAGAMAGGTLGASLGGSSLGGQLIGGAGGAIAGTLLTGLITTGSIGGATTGGIFGASAGLFGLSGAATFGIGLAVAGALMLGSYLFGRAARRKAEKKQVNQLSGDALNRIRQLIEDVKHFKIDGSSAYDQAVQIRDQYAEQIAQLKTGPGKRLAQQKLTEINSMLGTLKSEGERADRQRDIAQITDDKVVPTFASGGMSSAFTGYGGFGGGAQLVGVHANEAIINASQIMALGGYRRLAEVGVRGISMSGAPERNWNRQASVAPTSANNQPTFNAFFMDEKSADQWIDKVSPSGVAKKMRIAVHTEDDAGFIDATVKRMSE